MIAVNKDREKVRYAIIVAVNYSGTNSNKIKKRLLKFIEYSQS